MLPDLVKCYGACGRTIIFTETKKDANELTNVLSESNGARALHGDIPQVPPAHSTPERHVTCGSICADLTTTVQSSPPF